MKGINPQPIYIIFEQAKNVCSRLEIRSADEDTLYEVFSNPNDDLANGLDIDSECDQDNSLKEDIVIESLPYVFDCPSFDSINGLKVYKLHAKQGKAWYNESYIKQRKPTL